SSSFRYVSIFSIFELCNDKEEKNEIKEEKETVQKIIDEANDFVKSCYEALNNSNIEKIETYLNDEEKIVEMFNICNYDSDIVKNPEIWAYYYIAEGFYKIGKNEETAYKYYKKAITLMENTQNQDDKLKALLFRDMAWNSFEMRASNDFEDENVKKALNDIETAISLNPEDCWSFYCQGWMYYHLGDKDKAKELLNKAKSLCKNIKDKKEIQGWIDKIKKIDEANNFVKNFVNAVNNSESNTIKRLLEEGETKIVEMFEISNNYRDVSKAPSFFAYYFIADGYFIIDNYYSANKYYTKAISSINANSNIDTNVIAGIFQCRARSIFYMNENNMENAKKAYNDIQRAISYDGNNWFSNYFAGTLCVKLKDRNAALNYFEKAKSLCPDENNRQNIQTWIDKINDDQFWDDIAEIGEGFLKGLATVLPLFL
ncbi:MAG: tetratricopeptide repeat protein, partial [Endomicrobiaceae bacterium]|nr:tetratricopeptide repeat protein [Endomicrobiaceae bacterium]